jgi:hypothetical protein
MLELILTRPNEDNLIRAAQKLEFIVLDEMHTYRGRQGADVALLLRRVRELVGNPRLRCVGTSATLAGPGSWEQQRIEVSKLATQLFGSPLSPESVIGETLRRATTLTDDKDPTYAARINAALLAGLSRPLATFNDFRNDPVAGWIEATFGVKPETESGRLVRSKPLPLRGDTGAAGRLSQLTGAEESFCEQVITQTLLRGATDIRDPETNFPLFPFRLHQFISRGDTLYSTVEPLANRYMTIYGQRFSPTDKSKILLPLCFCRECGQEYFSVFSTTDPETGATVFLPREAHDRSHQPGQAPGFLFVSEEKPWPSPNQTEAIFSRLPADWIQESNAKRKLDPKRADGQPVRYTVRPDGTAGPDGIPAAFVPAPFLFCLNCGISHNPRQRSDFPKVGTLGSEGRSTATTILATSTVAALRRETTLDPTARKLLSFTDNRQDASLQAGHLNDFVEVGLLRGAIYKAALQAGAEGLRDASISQQVTEALNLDKSAYAADPEVKYEAAKRVTQALRDVIGYRIYRDLRRGWRISAPNLEQCGLLEIEYASLTEVCADQEVWQKRQSRLARVKPQARELICRTLLDYIRRELCIEVNYLDFQFQDQLKRRSASDLKEPWALDEAETLTTSSIAFPCSEGESDSRNDAFFVSPKGGFGHFLKSRNAFPDGAPQTTSEAADIIRDLFDVLRIAGIVKEIVAKDQGAPVPGYQINAGSLIWRAGDGKKAYHDRIRTPTQSAEGSPVNPFFVEFYRSKVGNLHNLPAREHTAQVPTEKRKDREEQFRAAKLPILFCSSTMELGIDIRDLNSVNMRNVPPTPANYAQRSGRAGRSGQPAFVFTYCSAGSPHDQYFFKHPDLMVSGAVTTPRIDITNEDLLRAHIHAIWLREASLDLRNTPADLLVLTTNPPSLDLTPEVQDCLNNQAALQSTRARARRILDAMASELAKAPWYADGWLEEVIRGIKQSFEQAFERWRYLYRTARKQADDQHRLALDNSITQQQRDAAERLRREALTQLTLLTDKQANAQSDFYSYRYFASEGFLPGYNFPRLPLSAFIPGRRTREQNDEFISRPRFLAISEFGPGALIYHEGARYQVTRVMMPVGDDKDPVTTSLKLCAQCGYLHPYSANNGPGNGPNNCDRCNAELAEAPLTSMFRMQNVITRRRQRISCDEEERLRLGYDIRTAIRFAERQSRPLFSSTTLRDGQTTLAKLSYGDAATIWRINLGWSRRQNKNEKGFWLDLERRQWTRSSIDPDDDQEEGKPPRLVQRVIPYVQDRRNSLLFEPAGGLSLAQMASLEYALKRAIQIHYQLEDAELASESLPDASTRRMTLFYEAAEGGAGVLRHLVSDPSAVPTVATRALELLHFSPASGADENKADHATERCQTACYDCLLSYYNQRDHLILDRHTIKDYLMQLSRCTAEPSPVETPRPTHLLNLDKLCETTLERDFLAFLEHNDLALPTDAQKSFPQYGTRPDFAYLGANPAFVYVDGPPHDYPSRQQRDMQQTANLHAAGITVIRFHHQDEWLAIVRQHPSTFGTPQ